MKSAEFRKWLAIGTGVGIEIGREDLRVVVARVRPSGVRVTGVLTVNRFRETPAADWGGAYTSFLRKTGAGHLAATVLLPREDVIVRQLQMPGIADRDLAAALQYQIDTLHPYPEDEAAWDFARARGTSSVLVAITRRAVLDRYTALFAEAGIKVAAFTCSAAVLYSAARLYQAPPEQGFVAVAAAAAGGVEAYGESAARPVFSARLDLAPERAVALALSELRLAPETEPRGLDSILPKPLIAPEHTDLSQMPLPYATALAGACPRLALPLNLLPADQRRTSSRWRYVPTAVLGVLLLAALALYTAYGNYENTHYVSALQSEVAKYEPGARKAAALDRAIELARNRAQMLDNFRLRSKDDMDALNDLSRVLAPPTWLSSMQLTRSSLAITGETEQSAGLLKVLDGTKQFKRSEFTMPMSRTGNNAESFSVRSAREGITP